MGVQEGEVENRAKVHGQGVHANAQTLRTQLEETPAPSSALSSSSS